MLELATTRPETMLGDTAVCHQSRRIRATRDLHGCNTVMLPLINKEIPIVCRRARRYGKRHRRQ